MPPDAYFPDKVQIMEAEPPADTAIIAPEPAPAPAQVTATKAPPATTEPDSAVQVKEITSEPEAEAPQKEEQKPAEDKQ